MTPSTSTPRSTPRTGPTRRTLLWSAAATTGVAGAAVAGAALSGQAAWSEDAPEPAAPVEVPAGTSATDPEVSALEATYGVTIGLHLARLAGAGQARAELVEHRTGTRFPLMSTFKTLAVAAVQATGESLDTVVRWGDADVVDYSPITGERREASLGEICDATLRWSDNTAGNLLLDRIGGPEGLTRWLRTQGDTTTRLDRREPDLNEALPGDPRDSTTPRAIAATYERLLTAPGPQRWQLLAWMQGNTTSVDRFRAALPDFWSFADKTGSGAYATAHDVGLLTTPDGTRLVVAAMTRGDVAEARTDPALMVDLGRLVVARSSG